MSTKFKINVCLWVLCWVFIITIFPIYQVITSRFFWSEAKATIENFSVKSHTSVGSRSTTTYQINLLYSYEYKGKMHTSNRVTLTSWAMGFNTYSFSQEERIWKPGKTITCYVNPRQPGKAVLWRWMKPNAFFSFSLLFLWGIILLTSTNEVLSVLIGPEWTKRIPLPSLTRAPKVNEKIVTARIKKYFMT